MSDDLGYYILDKRGRPRRIRDARRWGRWMATADRRVDRTTIEGFTVSTVFLGMDHSFGEQLLPVLYETMVFGPSKRGRDFAMRRYCTRGAAIKGHHEMVAEVRAALGIPQEKHHETPEA